MADVIRVTPETLSSTAENFKTQNAAIKNLTTSMLEKIRTLQNSWSGEAAQVYQAKFNALSSDMEKMYAMINTYADNLQAMAANYNQADSENIQKGQSLANPGIQ